MSKTEDNAVVVCLHSSASSGAQWRSLRSEAPPDWRLITPDLYGYGTDARQDKLEGFSLQDEIGWLEKTWEDAGPAFHLVGHSYGGLIALAVAMRNPQNVLSLTVYEPAVWSLLTGDGATNAGAQEIEKVRGDTIDLAGSGELHEAARRFVTYWAGPAAWDAMPNHRRDIVAKAMPKVRSEFLAEMQAHALGVNTLGNYALLRMPKLCLSGEETTAGVKNTMQVFRTALKDNEFSQLVGVRHLGPSTHPHLVNTEIIQFIASHA